MQRYQAPKRLFLVALLCLLLIFGMGCTQAVESADDDIVPTVEEQKAPVEVIVARNAVLDFLREGAIICVPPEGVQWQLEVGGEETPAGFGVYRFVADDCAITVSFPLATATEPLYHVAVGHGIVGFCWQAVVDGNGRIVKTGSAAQLEPGPGNPASIYCTNEGYQYEIRTTDEGTQCGACVFPDGSACKGWDFFFGECGPGDSHQ
ncbi:MAG: DUF333 domain-containing protein [Ardenticatenaceae bacterium]|nr:DUF333 domain-containing protein [Ardenticatenaceae bacterium]